VFIKVAVIVRALVAGIISTCNTMQNVVVIVENVILDFTNSPAYHRSKTSGTTLLKKFTTMTFVKSIKDKTSYTLSFDEGVVLCGLVLSHQTLCWFLQIFINTKNTITINII
jgi:hypothetical protein